MHPEKTGALYPNRFGVSMHISTHSKCRGVVWNVCISQAVCFSLLAIDVVTQEGVCFGYGVIEAVRRIAQRRENAANGQKMARIRRGRCMGMAASLVFACKIRFLTPCGTSICVSQPENGNAVCQKCLVCE